MTAETRATCAAPAKIFSISRALLPSSGTGPGQSIATLPGASGQSCGASGAERRAHIRDRVELLVVDRDQLGGVLRLRDALGHHQRDRLADMHARARARAPGGTARSAWLPLRPMSGGCSEVEPTPAASRSLWVSTATTPGAARAAAMSIDLMRACACGERTNTRIGLVRLRRVLDETPEPAHQRVVLDARLEMMVMLLGHLIHARSP